MDTIKTIKDHESGPPGSGADEIVTHIRANAARTRWVVESTYAVGSNQGFFQESDTETCIGIGDSWESALDDLAAQETVRGSADWGKYIQAARAIMIEHDDEPDETADVASDDADV